mmetsp:Transcript_7041/g.18185  ORF Transcript_7041/g.18185 Transcript_7041/m.18185 type:complete len:246 (+) Transcript_7041:902-1639(+)
MTMLMHQLHNPPAALFLPAMMSGLKCSIARYIRTSLKLTAGTFPSSKPVLKLLRLSKNTLGSFKKTFLAQSQVRSLSLTLPDFWTGTAGSYDARSTRHALKTSSTPGGGLDMVLHICRSFTSNVSSAAMAASTAGSACARSASADSFFSLTSAAILVTFFSSMLAFSVSISTTSFSAAHTLAILSEVAFFSSASATSPAMDSLRTSTTAVVSSNFLMPFWRRRDAVSFSALFRASSSEYSLSSSR